MTGYFKQKEYSDILELRRLVNDLITVIDYKNNLSWHSERETYFRIARDLKEEFVSKVKEALIDNEIISDTLDELYNDLENQRAVQIAELEKALFKALHALDEAQSTLRDLKKNKVL